MQQNPPPYLFDLLAAFAVDAMAAAANADSGKATMRHYTSALRTALAPCADMRATEIDVSAINAAFDAYHAAVTPTRFAQVRGGWRHFRQWLAQTRGINLPPGRILTDVGRRGRHDPLPRAQPLSVTAQDVADLKVLLQGTGGRLPLRDLLALRWEHLSIVNNTETGVPEAIHYRRAANDNLAFTSVGLVQALVARRIRFRGVQHGPVFPRVPGVDEPLSLADAQQAIERG